MDQVQQGDVIGRKIRALPDGATRVGAQARGLVVAEGEATGHAHVVPDLDGVDLYQGPDGLVLVNATDQAVPMTHEEHRSVTWPPGIWEIGIVRERDWIAETTRRVMD